MFKYLKRKICVEMFYYWHASYHKWMNSIAKSDLETLEKELEAIELKKKDIVNDEFYEYSMEMLAGQGAIVKRIIEEIKNSK